MPTIRAAAASDEAELFRLLRQLVGDRRIGDELIVESPRARRVFGMLLDGARGHVLVAEDRGRILGIISVSYNLAIRYGGEYAQIEELVVDEAARGMNLGAALVSEVIEVARARGCAEIGLYSREHNRAFYEKFGFEYAGPELRRALLSSDGGAASP